MCDHRMISLQDDAWDEVPLLEDGPLKLWEIDRRFKCPLIGLGMTPEEQRHLLKKNGVRLKDKTEFHLHEVFVGHADCENPLSQKTDRFLFRKFGKSALFLLQMPEADFLQRWKTALAGDDYMGEFWAAAVRRDLSSSARGIIFGDIHMAMHFGATRIADAERRLRQARSREEALAAQVKELHRGQKRIQKEDAELRQALAGLERRVQQVMQENQILKSGAGEVLPRHPDPVLGEENRRLSEIVREQCERLCAQDRILAVKDERIGKISRELEEERQAGAAFRKEAEEILQSFSEMGRCDAGCPAFDLCRKRVLIVGGIARMESLYRRLIEAGGGTLEYHDGYMQGGGRQLENSLKRSDIVLCPVNCNSHSACIMVKNLGKKYQKPVHMLPSFSLSSVSQAIRESGALVSAN